VSDALEALLLQQQGEDSPDPENWDSGYAVHLANYLAPRVAAAIEAAATQPLRRATNDTVVRQREDAALKALRGAGSVPSQRASDEKFGSGKVSP